MTPSQVVLIDRDGVINVDLIGDYIKRWEDFRFHDGVLEGLKQLSEAGFKIIILSNQAGVGDGLFTEQAQKEVHEKMAETLNRSGIKLHAAYYCLHGKEAGCSCRKPRLGLFEKAASQIPFDRSKTYFLGDKVTDIEAGKNFGLKTILVRTGYGAEAERECIGKLKPDLVVDHFEEAVQRVLCG